MEQEHAQPTPDEAMANLAFATKLQEQLMGSPVEGSNDAENAPETTETQETGETAPSELTNRVAQLEQGIEEIKALIKQDNEHTELEQIKAQLQELLANEQ